MYTRNDLFSLLFIKSVRSWFFFKNHFHVFLLLTKLAEIHAVFSFKQVNKIPQMADQILIRRLVGAKLCLKRIFLKVN